jgi:hypothetical protein
MKPLIKGVVFVVILFFSFSANSEYVYSINISEIENNNTEDTRVSVDFRDGFDFVAVREMEGIGSGIIYTCIDCSYEAATEPLVYIAYQKKDSRGRWLRPQSITLNLLAYCLPASSCILDSLQKHKIGPFGFNVSCEFTEAN